MRVQKRPLRLWLRNSSCIAIPSPTPSHTNCLLSKSMTNWKKPCFLPSCTRTLSITSWCRGSKERRGTCTVTRMHEDEIDKTWMKNMKEKTADDRWVDQTVRESCTFSLKVDHDHVTGKYCLAHREH